jgi:hypothetical protein
MREWIYRPVFLTSALVGGEWSASCPCCFTFMERTLYPLDRRFGGHLDDMEKRKFFILPGLELYPPLV